MRLDDAQTILYTRGSVDFFRTYSGLYVPNPVVLHAQRRDTPDWNHFHPGSDQLIPSG
jgi:hypothetical protein